MAKENKRQRSKEKKKDQTPPPVPAEETLPEPDAEETTPEPACTCMTDRRAVEILFAVTQDPKDIPDMTDWDDEGCANELKENIGLLEPNDANVIKERFPEEADAALDRFTELGFAIPEPKPAAEPAKKSSKASKTKAEKKEKPAGEKKKGPPPRFTEYDEYGFGIGSNGHKFVEYLKTGPKTMKECKEADWNPTKATFMDPMKKLIEAGKAKKHEDGKIELIGFPGKKAPAKGKAT